MRKAQRLSADVYLAGIRAGDRTVLSRAITLVESTRPEDYVLAQAVIAGCLPHGGGAFRVGISGVPGAGSRRPWP